MESIFEWSQYSNGSKKIINSVGEKAWLPESAEFFGFYNYQTAVPECQLEWTEEIHDKKEEKFPKKMEIKIKY